MDWDYEFPDWYIDEYWRDFWAHESSLDEIPGDEDPYDRELKPYGRGNRERKEWLEKNKDINCGLCPINRFENAYGKRRPLPDNDKNHRRGKRSVHRESWGRRRYHTAEQAIRARKGL